MNSDPPGSDGTPNAPQPPRHPPTVEEWERRWQGYWSHAGALDYIMN